MVTAKDRINEIAENVPQRVQEIVELCGRRDLTQGLARLALYRFIILCGR
jgi:hypothetical protein